MFFFLTGAGVTASVQSFNKYICNQLVVTTQIGLETCGIIDEYIGREARYWQFGLHKLHNEELDS